MVKKRSPKLLKTQNQIVLALESMKNEEFSSINQTAKHYGVQATTLARRVSGKHETRDNAFRHRQLLSEAEENALAKWCRQLTIAGYPIPHILLQDVAAEIRSQRVVKGDTNGTTYPPCKLGC
jgi:helix-turn-helix, Psq domain/Tc5 transposase DNA-binding domain